MLASHIKCCDLINSSLHTKEVQISHCSFSVDAYRQKIVKVLYEFTLLWISFYFGFVMGIWNFVMCVGSLKYWYQRNKVDFLVSQSAVWNDDAVQGSLDCAAFWVKDLPFVKSLSGYWKFFIADRPSNVPTNFYETEFHDSEWKNLPGKCLCYL